MNMSKKQDGDKVARALVAKRWKKASDEQKTEQGKKMAAARWAGHTAKRPASSRRKPGKG